MAHRLIFLLVIISMLFGVYSRECTAVLPDSCMDPYNIINVQNSSSQQDDCTNGTTCSSLSSALSYISTIKDFNSTWIIQVHVRYNYLVDSVNVAVNVSCLVICGINQPLIYVNNGSILVQNDNYHGLLFLANINFSFKFSNGDINKLYYFDIIKFVNVVISNGFDWYLHANSIYVSESIFNNNSYVSALLTIQASHNCSLSNVSIYNSIAYGTSANGPLHVISQPDDTKFLSVTIAECRIQHSTASSLLQQAASLSSIC